jgi:toxin-antitoxin system PIN domain toxin
VSVTVDANILIYASNEADPAHATARELIERLAAGPDLVYLFWPVVSGYLRIVTHAAILPRPLRPEDAMANIDAFLTLGHVRAPGEPSDFWSLFQLTAGSDVRGNLVPDAHLAALMRAHGVATVYSRDRDLRRFDAITVVDPFASS